MKRIILLFAASLLGIWAGAQTLHVEWEKLTAVDFPTAVARADSVCIIPMGVLEKHGSLFARTCI